MSAAICGDRARMSLYSSELPAQKPLRPLRRDWMLGDRARYPDGIVDGRRNCGPNPGDAALTGSLDAQRIEGADVILAQHHLDARRLPRGRQQIICKAC